MAKNILICDDAAFMRMMIKDILTKNGYNIAGEAENILNHHSHECSIITNQNILCHKLSPIQKQIIHKIHSNVLYNKCYQFPTLFLIF